MHTPIPRRLRTGACGVLFLLSAGAAQATTATWTNTSNTVDFWVNTANWNASSYPGQNGANQGAYLTNSVPNAVYKAVVNATLPNTLARWRFGIPLPAAALGWS